MATSVDPVPPLTEAEELALLDAHTRRSLNLSAEEFLRKWHAGEFGDPDRTPGLMRIVMLLPNEL